MPDFPTTTRNRVRRPPARVSYDAEVIYRIIFEFSSRFPTLDCPRNCRRPRTCVLPRKCSLRAAVL
jgi:hypothetical protein